MNKNPLPPMTSTEKSAKRVYIMNTVAIKITGDEDMTWRKFETALKKAHQSGKTIKVVIK